MSDRPAAELLAELSSNPEILSVHASVYYDALERLARAEQALAEIDKLADQWLIKRPDQPVSEIALVAVRMCGAELRAALRVTQGGQ